MDVDAAEEVLQSSAAGEKLASSEDTPQVLKILKSSAFSNLIE